MKKVFVLALIMMVNVLPACTVLARVPVNPDYTQIFYGETTHNITSQAGIPDNEVSDGRDGVIYEYSNWKRLKSKTDFLRKLQNSHNISYVRNIAFFFDKEDNCYLVTTEAQRFQRQYSPGRTKALILGVSASVTGVGLFALMMVYLVNAMSPPTEIVTK